MKNGTKSPYYDWYFINGDVNDENFFKDHNTRDSRYYSLHMFTICLSLIPAKRKFRTILLTS